MAILHHVVIVEPGSSLSSSLTLLPSLSGGEFVSVSRGKAGTTSSNPSVICQTVSALSDEGNPGGEDYGQTGPVCLATREFMDSIGLSDTS